MMNPPVMTHHSFSCLLVNFANLYVYPVDYGERQSNSSRERERERVTHCDSLKQRCVISQFR